jgi:hypothetical protein
MEGEPALTIGQDHDPGTPRADGPAAGTWPAGYEDDARKTLSELAATGDTPPAVAIATGLSALTYAVLALRETAVSTGADVASSITDAAASYACAIANAIGDASWPATLRRLVLRLTPAAWKRRNPGHAEP